jgi:16S rRNA (guanine527-N7)-methyltransferase
MNSREFQERLARRTRRAGVPLPADLGLKLEAYYRLLATWNQRINLTGVNLVDPTPDGLDRLLVEPLVAANHAAPGTRRIIDIGSGGGSPAIPFTLSLAGAHVLMVESKTRKSVFLREALRAVEISGSDVVTGRFEELLSNPSLHEAHDLLTIRAVRVESRILVGLQALVRPGGQIFLFRSSSGPDPSESVTPPLSWRATYPLIEALRSRLVVLDKRQPSRVSRGT